MIFPVFHAKTSDFKTKITVFQPQKSPFISIVQKGSPRSHQLTTDH